MTNAIERLLKAQSLMGLPTKSSPDNLHVAFDTPNEALVYDSYQDAGWLWRKSSDWSSVYIDLENLPVEGEDYSYFAQNTDKYEKMFDFLWGDDAYTVYRDRMAIFVA